MPVSRRSVVSMLGLAPAGVGIDNFLDQPTKPATVQSANDCSKASQARALRNLADAIDHGDVHTTSINYHSAIAPKGPVEHQVVFSFLYEPELKA
jgi:hypothetical protein